MTTGGVHYSYLNVLGSDISVKIGGNVSPSLTSQKVVKTSNTEKEVEKRRFVFCVLDAGINMVKRMI